MKNNKIHEKILISIAIILCSGIVCYNLFFIPDISIPTVVYVDKDSEASQVNLNTEDQKSIQKDQPDQSLVNINTANAEELIENLPRVGEKMASRIIEYREANNGFKNIDELKNVSGIGEKSFEKLKNLICI